MTACEYGCSNGKGGTDYDHLKADGKGGWTYVSTQVYSQTFQYQKAGGGTGSGTMTVTVRTDGGHKSAQIVFKKGPDPKPAKKETTVIHSWAMGTNVNYDPNVSDEVDRPKLATWQKVVLGVVSVVSLGVAAAPVAIALGEGCLATAPVCAVEIAETLTGGASGGSLTIGGAAIGVGARRAVTAAEEDLPKGPVTLYGPFHRKGSPTQTAFHRDLIVESGELWGTIPRHGVNPTAQAWRGPIPKDAKTGSLEFYTTVQPKAYNRTTNGQVAWEATEQEVRTFERDGKEWASIPIIITEAR
ncbi:hypothetical protein ABZV80_33460 [Streptomyces sp. NPDC005132]|uniref:hypothetical protein n=1 Tax=Streptomyces sp. NPDC005132 TaxID=3154294 RepID=UPI0033BB9AB4